MSISRSNTAGLDFGTSHSTISYFDEEGNRVVAEDDRGSRYIPSVVSCIDQLRVGYDAKKEQVRFSENTITDVKRLLGKGMADPGVSDLISNLPYKVVEGASGRVEFEIMWQGQKKRVAPEEIVRYIIDYMCSLVTKKTGYDIENLVVTVPAHFDNTQRACLIEAAKMTGRTVLQCLDEPSAAALSFSITNDLNNKRVLVYDFGGGTFDVSVMDIDNYVYNVIFTDGDSQLGGSDINKILFEYILEWFNNVHGLDVTSYSAVSQRIRNIAESIKIYFSQSNYYEDLINIEPLVAIVDDDMVEDVQFSMDIQQYNDLIRHVIEKTLTIVQNTMNNPRVVDRPIDMIALIGGSSNICLVKELLDVHYPNAKVLSTDDPRCAVSLGALIYADQLIQNEEEKTKRHFDENGRVMLEDQQSYNVGDNRVILESVDGVSAFRKVEEYEIPTNYTASLLNDLNSEISSEMIADIVNANEAVDEYHPQALPTVAEEEECLPLEIKGRSLEDCLPVEIINGTVSFIRESEACLPVEVPVNPQMSQQVQEDDSNYCLPVEVPAKPQETKLVNEDDSSYCLPVEKPSEKPVNPQEPQPVQEDDSKYCLPVEKPTGSQEECLPVEKLLPPQDTLVNTQETLYRTQGDRSQTVDISNRQVEGSLNPAITESEEPKKETIGDSFHDEDGTAMKSIHEDYHKTNVKISVKESEPIKEPEPESVKQPEPIKEPEPVKQPPEPMKQPEPEPPITNPAINRNQESEEKQLPINEVPIPAKQDLAPQVNHDSSPPVDSLHFQRSQYSDLKEPRPNHTSSTNVGHPKLIGGSPKPTGSEIILKKDTEFICLNPVRQVLVRRQGGKIHVFSEDGNERELEEVEDYRCHLRYAYIYIVINQKVNIIKGSDDGDIILNINHNVVTFLSKSRLIFQLSPHEISNSSISEGTSLHGTMTTTKTITITNDPEEAKPKIEICTVTGLDIGCLNRDGLMSVIIPRGTPALNACMEKKYNASQNYPTEVFTTIYQGNCSFARDNVRVGDIRMRNLRLREDNGRGCIFIRLSIDDYGLIKTEVRQHDEDEYQVIPMKNKIILDPAMLKAKQEEAERTREYDELYRKYVSLKAEVDDRMREYRECSVAPETEKKSTLSRWERLMVTKKPMNPRAVTPSLLAWWENIIGEIRKETYKRHVIV